MAYRWVDHTAEVELRIHAATEAEVFADALRALAELIGGAAPSDGGGSDDAVAAPDRDGAPDEAAAFDVAVTAPDRATRLALWLDELVFRAESEGLVAEEAVRLELAGDRVAATVRATRQDAPHLVKGVTYHRLAFDATADGFRATVVLDV